MSTLNSSQLYVKRSSTRLHAPPGGHSSLSFGPGGFGTTDDEKASSRDPAEPAMPPSTAGSFRGSSGGYGSYNHPANNQDMGYAQPPAFHSIKPSYGQAAPPSNVPAYSSYVNDCPAFSRPPSTQSNYSWGERGAQPPLTSSKRDQNWEKKRRLWLARKNGGAFPAPPGTASSFGVPATPLPPPPMTDYGGSTNSYYDPEPNVYNAPSPLTKFMAQQQHQQPHYFASQAPPSTASSTNFDVAMIGRPSSSATVTTQQIPPRTAYREELHSAAAPAHTVGYGSMNDMSRGLPPYGSVDTPGTSAGYAAGRAGAPGTASSTMSSSSRRQAPGGTSTWSPYS